MFSLARILPRDDKFNARLNALADSARECGQALHDFIGADDDTKRTALTAQIEAARLKAKQSSADITRELCQAFITPFDREDISDLAGHLYKIAKTTGKVCDYLEMNAGLKATDFSEQAAIIHREGVLMKSLTQALTSGGKAAVIEEHAGQIDLLESEGDAVRRRLLAELFSNTADARELILKKDLYDLMERVIDRYRNAGEVAVRMALKHA